MLCFHIPSCPLSDLTLPMSLHQHLLSFLDFMLEPRGLILLSQQELHTCYSFSWNILHSCPFTHYLLPLLQVLMPYLSLLRTYSYSPSSSIFLCILFSPKNKIVQLLQHLIKSILTYAIFKSIQNANLNCDMHSSFKISQEISHNCIIKWLLLKINGF